MAIMTDGSMEKTWNLNMHTLPKMESEVRKWLEHTEPKNIFPGDIKDSDPCFFIWNCYIDVGDEMCWRQLWDVGDGFDRSRHQHPLCSNIGVWHQHSKDATNIEIVTTCHQHLCSRKIPQTHAFHLKLISQRFQEIQRKHGEIWPVSRKQ